MTNRPARLPAVEALDRLIRYEDVRSVLDVGSGEGLHAAAMREAGKEVFTVNLEPPADHVGDFLSWHPGRVGFDAVWASHVLEHQVNPGEFLRACRYRLRPGGLLAITVPPAKHAIVGGHVSLWNAGLLLYHLVLAGFDCRPARVGSYGYNLSVIVPRGDITLPLLRNDCGDIETLAEFFPIPVKQGFDGRLSDIRWQESVR